jgi:VWFA-related protein
MSTDHSRSSAQGTEQPCRSYFRLFCLLITTIGLAKSLSSQNATSPLSERPLASIDDTKVGLIKVDVVVTDKSGKPATGLEWTDLELLDNGQPNKILSFQAFDEASARPDQAAEIILVIDTLRMPGMLASHEREEVEKFLRLSDGHLVHPVSIFRLRDSGLWLVADPSKDGTRLATAIVHDDQGRSIRKAFGPSGLFGSGPEETPGLLALKSLGDILTLERQRSGRKLLIWVGPRREENGAPFEQQRVFNMIVWFSTLLREARVALYSYSEGENKRDVRAIRYRDLLNGAKSIRDARFEDFSRKVLAVQSGGRVLDLADEDLADQIYGCVAEASHFYTLSFNPLPANHPNEYHELSVQVRMPGFTARSNSGYYDQPYYQDQAKHAKRVTVEQLDQLLKADHGKSDGDMAQRLSNLELSERMSKTKISSWIAELHGAKARQALLALAGASAFLAPPATEIPTDPPPDASAQRKMISLADEYLNETIPHLPNFLATRTTVRYAETPPHDENNSTIEYQPLHMVESSKERVLYSRGQEVVDAAAAKHARPKNEGPNLSAYGTFGPVLGAAIDAVVASTDFRWSRWERDASGLRAVFRYVIPQEKSHFRVGYCCLPDGDGTTSFQTVQGYHGEITINPVTGAILWLTMEADLNAELPIVRSEVMVSYGPVDIGGKTYICPVTSIAIWRSRTVGVLALTDWGDSFRSYGPFATMLNEMDFDDYHIFRAESHVLTGVPEQEKK